MQKPIKQQDFYHFQHTPFSHQAASQAPFMGSGQQHVINTIQQAIASGQLLFSLCGETGLGKTTLIQIVLAQLASSPLTPIYIEASNLDAEMLGSHIAHALGLTKLDTESSVTLDTLPSHVAQNELSAQPILLVVDDAHKMSVATLKKLGQLVTQSQLSIQVILVGQPMLVDTCQQARLQEQVRTLQLGPLTPAESAAYIQHHVHYATARGDQTVFSPGAINAITQFAGGVPHTLNVICTDVLCRGCGELENPISANTTRQVIAEFPGLNPRRRLPFSSSTARQVIAELPRLKLHHRLPLKWVATGTACALIAWGGLSLPGLLSNHHETVVLAGAQTSLQPTPSHLTTLSAPTLADISVPEPLIVAAKRNDAIQAERFTAEEPTAIAQSELTSPKPIETATMLPASVSSSADALTRIESALLDVLPDGSPFSLHIQATNHLGTPYQEGDAIGFRIQASADVYLRIDYYQADGRVVQLLPQPLVSNRAKAGTPFTLGTANSPFPLVVAPPFGEEMLVVIASRQSVPLQADLLSEASADHYAVRLAQSLATLKTQGEVAATTLRLRTQPRAKAKWSPVTRPQQNVTAAMAMHNDNPGRDRMVSN